MKKKLIEFEHLHLMKRNTKLHPECFYLLTSESTSQSLYFESRKDIEYAHKQLRKNLHGIVDVIDYLFTPYGWMLCIEVKRANEILSFCKRKKELSNKVKDAIKDKNVSIIISEAFRNAISSIIKKANYNHKRNGTVVKENFSRYVFENIEVVQSIVRLMKREQIDLCKQNKRYRPKMKYWDEKGELSNVGDIFLCTRKMREGDVSLMRMGLSLVIRCRINHVLRKIISSTFITHLHQITAKKHQIPTNFST